MSEDPDMTATQLGNAPWFKAGFRFITPLLHVFVVACVTMAINTLKTTNSKIDETNSKIDAISRTVDKINWEIPAIKAASQSDKAELLTKLADMKEMTAKDLQTFEGRIRSLYDRYEALSIQMNELRLEMAKTVKAGPLD